MSQRRVGERSSFIPIFVFGETRDHRLSLKIPVRFESNSVSSSCHHPSEPSTSPGVKHALSVMDVRYVMLPNQTNDIGPN